MTSTEPVSAIVKLVDGPVRLSMEKVFSPSWRVGFGQEIHFLMNSPGYSLAFRMATMTVKPVDRALVLVSDPIDLAELNKRGLEVTLKNLELSLQEAGWVPATPWA